MDSCSTAAPSRNCIRVVSSRLLCQYMCILCGGPPLAPKSNLLLQVRYKYYRVYALNQGQMVYPAAAPRCLYCHRNTPVRLAHLACSCSLFVRHRKFAFSNHTPIHNKMYVQLLYQISLYSRKNVLATVVPRLARVGPRPDIPPPKRQLHRIYNYRVLLSAPCTGDIKNCP